MAVSLREPLDACTAGVVGNLLSLLTGPQAVMALPVAFCGAARGDKSSWVAIVAQLEHAA
jgi:hypothetical protein